MCTAISRAWGCRARTILDCTTRFPQKITDDHCRREHAGRRDLFGIDNPPPWSVRQVAEVATCDPLNSLCIFSHGDDGMCSASGHVRSGRTLFSIA